MVDTKDFKSILDLIKTFPDEQTCIDHLEKLRWNGTVISPFDPTSKVYDCKGNKYKCKNTGKYFNVKTATLFDNTKIELQTWFIAIYLITSHSKGISSVQLAKDLDVTQKTAWFMLHRIRNCFGIEENEQLDNQVEVDETYVGGENKNRSLSKRKKIHQDKFHTGMNDKTPVLGMLQRGGKVEAIVLNKAHAKEIRPILFDRIKDTATVITDGFAAYRTIDRYFDKHIVVNHQENEYVVGEYSTNSIEGFWSLVKRGFFGIYHYVSPKHMQKYLNSYAFRYNYRKASVSTKFNFMLTNMTNKLTYNTLVNG